MLIKKIFLFFIFTFLLSACNSPVYNQTEANIADAKLHTDAARHQSNLAVKRIPSLLVKNGMYVDRTPISLTNDPSWLENKIIIRGDQLPFSYYSRSIAGGGGKNVLTHYQVGLDETQKISINYAGTVRGALELLSAKAGYVYTVNCDSIYWQAFITKTYDIAFMPGASDYMMGKASGSSGISSVGMQGGSAGFGGSGGASSVSAIVDDSAASQYSNLKASLSIWKDLEATIKQLLSPQGTVMVSESTTSVTVRDRPSNLALVGKYIENLNRTLSRQVLVKVQILDISLRSDFNYGINWDLMKRTLDGTNLFLKMDFGTPVAITPLSGSASNEQFGITQMGSTAFNAIVNSLNQQGKVSIVTEPRVVCLNNQVSVIRIVSQQGYLASVQTTTLAGSSSASGGTVTSQLTPGSVTTGLTLYILPKILGNEVYLQVNADLSTNDGLTTISSTQGDITSGTTSTTPSNIIQVPNTTQKQFNQRSVIGSGDTLILAGFRQLNNQTGAMQLLRSQALGGKASTEAVKETIVLITPIILHGFA